MRAAVLIALLLIARSARAVVPLCIDVKSDTDERGLRALVVDELRHYPSHRLVDSGCASILAVELFTAAGVRYLTAHVNQEVPVRFALKSGRDLDDKLGEALRQILRQDPVYLAEDLSRMNAVWRAGANVLKNGSNRYRIDLFEVIGTAGPNAVFASGAALEVARGIDHVSVFARLAVAGSPHNRPDEITLRILAGADVGCAWEASARANNTVYLGGGLALHYVRFEGAPSVNPANTVLFSAVARIGARFLRYYGFDVDLFAQLHLPFYKANDPDSPLVDAYTPYALAGLGVGF
jgi:hypothetical protein